MKPTHVKFIKIIDKYAGSFLVTIFSHWEKLLYSKKKMSRPNKLRKILLVKFWGMGNIVLLLPIVKAVEEGYPESSIMFLTLSENKSILASVLLRDNVICLDMKNLLTLPIAIIKLIVKLRSIQFDLVLDFEEFSRFSTLLIYIAGIKNRIGFLTTNQYRGDLYTKTIFFDEKKHTIENFAQLPKQTSIVVKDLCPTKIRYSKEDETYINSILDGNVKKSDWLVGINVGTGPNAIIRRWPVAKFVGLANKLIKAFNAKLIFTGGESESEIINNFVKGTGYAMVNLTGLTNLSQLAYVIEKCSLFISNDSGPAHLAQAMGTPTVVIFGPESPIKYGPRDPRHIAIYKKVSCSPCLSVNNMKTSFCKNPRCLEDISVDEVFETAKKFHDKFISAN